MQRGEDPRVSDPVIEQLPIASPVTGMVSRRDPASLADVEVLTAAAYEEFADRLRAFVISATRDGSAADDIVQEAFIRLVREVQAGRRPDNIGAWLYRVASNLVISRGRRKSVVDRLKQVFPFGSQEPSPEEVALVAERDRTLALALARLPADARVALLLAARGMAISEIAVVIHRTPGATRTYLCRARVRLRNELTELGIGPRE
jgi:RNA polymerase sigma-70 factor (ECF subfamily)